MKKILGTAMALSILGFGAQALAQGGSPMINQGVQELGISGNADFDDPDGDFELDLRGTYGYFVQDNLEIGIRAGYTRSSGPAVVAIGPGDLDVDEFTIGGFGELHFPVSNLTVPYIGVNLDYSYADIDPGDSNDAFVVEPKAGVKWFVREYFAIDTNLFFKWATEDLYINDGELEDTDWGANVGLRVYFN